jgi:CRISPR-associated endonuclease Cas2
MSVYLVAYDLVNESKGTFDYQPLWAELKRLGAHRTQYSLWLLNVNNTAKEVVEHLKKYVDNNDRLWATSVRKGEHWYVNAMSGTNKWLEENPPT